MQHTIPHSVSFRMENHTVFLCLALIIISTHGVESENNITLNSIIQMQTRIFTENDESFNQTVPMKEMRASFDALEVLARDYTGDSKENITNVLNIGKQAFKSYFLASNRIYEWCNTTHDLLTQILQKNTPKEKLFDLMMNITGEGIRSIRESIDILMVVREQIKIMAVLLLPIPGKLYDEMNRLRKSYDEREKEVANFSKPAAAFKLEGIPPEVIDGQRIPNDNDESMRITEAYYEAPIEAVKVAYESLRAVENKFGNDVKSALDVLSTLKSKHIFAEAMKDFDIRNVWEIRDSIGVYLDKYNGIEALVA